MRGDATVYRLSVRLSVCLSVCPWRLRTVITYRLEFFENNFTAEQLKAYMRADPNVWHLVQREYPQK